MNDFLGKKHAPKGVIFAKTASENEEKTACYLPMLKNKIVENHCFVKYFFKKDNYLTKKS